MFALAGLVLVGASLTGLMAWQTAHDAAATANAGDARPPCATRLGPGYATISPEVHTLETAAPTVLFGVDLSPSNLDLSATQLDAARDYAVALPSSEAVGILLISDRSDRSSTPDMPFEPALATQTITPGQLPCAPNCNPDSLFHRKCFEQIEADQARRAAALKTDLDRELKTLHDQRAARITAWRAKVSDWKPRPGTSLLAFWAKIADLPVVRRSPESVTVMVFSDLVEARTSDRVAVEKFQRQFDATGTCPTAAWIPEGLSGLDIVLVQTVTDSPQIAAWAQRWDTLLTCAGAHVRRHRYSPATSIAEILGTRPVIAQR